MVRLAVALAIMAQLIVCARAQTDIITGNSYLPRCQAALDKFDDDAMLCLGIVFAARAYTYGLAGKHQACVPDAVPNVEVVKVVLNFLNENPKRLQESFVVLVAEALNDKWPCK